jgi:hypothetical protein
VTYEKQRDALRAAYKVQYIYNFNQDRELGGLRAYYFLEFLEVS